MKKVILAVLVATTLAVIIGVTAHYSGSGYVVFSFAEYTLETSFIFAAGTAALSFFVFYYIVRVLSHLFSLPSYMSDRHLFRKGERSKNALIKGLIEMSEGRFEQAEKILIKHANQSDTSLLNYLMAARAAQQLAAYDRRDEYLRLAHESTPSADMAIGLTQAELQLSHKQFEQALATLNHLSSVSPKHGYVKKLQARTYQQLEDWEHLNLALDGVKKYKAMSAREFEKIESESFIGMLKATIKQVDGDKSERIWQQLPKNLKRNTKLTCLYTSYLHSCRKDEEAEVLLRNFLSDNWDDELALLYSELEVSNNKRQLETAETWLHHNARNETLLLVLGKLSIKCEFWGKAKNYLETSIGLQPLAEAYLVLAQLLEEKMDSPEEAQKLYRLGLMSSVGKDSASHQYSNQLIAEKSQKPVLKMIQ